MTSARSALHSRQQRGVGFDQRPTRAGSGMIGRTARRWGRQESGGMLPVGGQERPRRERAAEGAAEEPLRVAGDGTGRAAALRFERRRDGAAGACAAVPAHSSAQAGPQRLRRGVRGREGRRRQQRPAHVVQDIFVNQRRAEGVVLVEPLLRMAGAPTLRGPQHRAGFDVGGVVIRGGFEVARDGLGGEPADRAAGATERQEQLVAHFVARHILLAGRLCHGPCLSPARCLLMCTRPACIAARRRLRSARAGPAAPATLPGCRPRRRTRPRVGRRPRPWCRRRRRG